MRECNEYEITIEKLSRHECHSKIQYKKAEVSFCSYITCPVCGVSSRANTILPVRYEEDE